MKQMTASEYLSLLNSMSNFAGILDKDGRVEFVNKAPIESLGYVEEDVEEDVIGKKYWETPWFNRSKETQEKVRNATLRALEKGERVQIEITAFMKDGTPFPAILNTGPLRDEEGEIIGAVVEGKPITEQKKLEEQLRKTIEKLKAAQEELMTPVVQVWENILALPIIGVVDSYRAQKIMETLLNRIVKTQSEMVIIDITGVASMDTEVANHLVKTVKAANLLGCTCVITGVRPEVAQTMIHLGINFGELVTKRDMQEGLKDCLERMGYEIRKRADGGK